MARFLQFVMSVSDSPVSAPLAKSQFLAARWIPAGLALALAAVLVWKRRWLTDYLALSRNPNPAFKEIMPATVWPGLAGAAVLLTVLALTARWWARAWPAALPGPETGKAPRWFVVALLLLTLAGAAVRVPRLGLSLYNDEAHVFRLHLAGAVPKRFNGQPDKFKEVKWLSTLYENRAGNNSMPFSVLARGSFDLWRKMTGAPASRVNETTIRLPVLVFGVLSIAAMGWLGFRLGGVWLGVAVAAATAFHPWHMRYSVEARCYGMLMFFMPVLFLALHRALRTGSWRAWLGFAAAEYFAMACFLGIAHFMLALNLTLAVVAAAPALARRSLRAVSWNLLVPAVVAGLLSAALYLAVNFPLFWQSSRLMENPNYLRGALTPEWFQNVGSHLLLGVPAREDDLSNENLLSLERFLNQSPAVTWSSLAVLLASLFAGAWRLLRSGGAGAAFVWASAGGAALMVGFCRLKGMTLLHWYPIFLLPGLLLALAAGFAWLSAVARVRARLPLWILAIPLAVLWGEALASFTRASREDFRSVVEFVRGAPYPESLKNPSGSLLVNYWSECPRYDGAAISPQNDEALDALIERARRENRPLFVEHGFISQMRYSFPQTLKQLSDPELFELVAIFHGLDDSESSHRVYRLKGKKP